MNTERLFNNLERYFKRLENKKGIEIVGGIRLQKGSERKQSYESLIYDLKIDDSTRIDVMRAYAEESKELAYQSAIKYNDVRLMGILADKIDCPNGQLEEMIKMTAINMAQRIGAINLGTRLPDFAVPVDGYVPLRKDPTNRDSFEGDSFQEDAYRRFEESRTE